MTQQILIHADLKDVDLDAIASCQTQITDPAYSPRVHENATSVGTQGRDSMGVQDRDLGFAPLTPEDRAFMAATTGILPRWSIFFSDIEGSQAWRDEGAESSEYVRTVPWIRWSQPQLSGDRPCSGSEQVLCFHADRHGPRGGRKTVAKHWNGPGSLTHFNRRCLRGKDKHPTEKPLDLALDLVCFFSDPGDSVLDLTAGHCTHALAARILGRGSVSAERDRKYYNAGRNRLRMTLSDRDRDRCTEWVVTTSKEALAVPEPKAKDGSDIKTWERAQRRLADVARVIDALDEPVQTYAVETLL